MPIKEPGKAYFMISAVAQRYDIHPQTLRMYEREGLLKPSRTEGNTRLYSPEDLEQLETILTLTRDLGVNLAGVEIILNMRRKMDQMQREVNEFVAYVKQEMARGPQGLDDWEERLSTALVKAESHHARPDHAVGSSRDPADPDEVQAFVRQAVTRLSGAARAESGAPGLRYSLAGELLDLSGHGLARSRRRRRATRRAVRVLA